MRSRDEHRSILFSICSLITFYLLFHSSVLCADEYLISYRYVVKNSRLFNESLYISKAMKPCQGSPYTSLKLPSKKNNNLKAILTTNKNRFLEFLSHVGIFIDNKEKTLLQNHTTTTILMLKTTCFKVDFNENFVIISPLK